MPGETAGLQTPIIAALAAILGGIIGFAGNYLLARRNLKKDVSLKVAEYRIEWINNLRDELSIFISSSITFMVADLDHKDRNDYFSNQYKSNTKILLLMNTKDQDYFRLGEIMTDMMKASGRPADTVEERAINHRMMHDLRKDYINLCNGILKREWQRTKVHLQDDTISVSALKSDYSPSWIYRKNQHE